MDDASVCRREAAGVEVERTPVVFEIDVEPFAAGRSRLLRRHLHQACANAAALEPSGRLRIDQKGVIDPSQATLTKPTRVPSACPCHYPSEALAPNLVPPSPLRPSAVRLDKFEHLVVA